MNIRLKRFNPSIRFFKEIFRREDKSVLAVEIGQEWIKAAYAKRAKIGTSIIGLSAKRFTRNEVRAAAEVLRNMIRELKAHWFTTVVSLPRHAVTVRYLRLPSVNPAEIGQMTDLQAVKQLPYSREELVTAHKALDRDAEGYTQVMLVAVHKKVLQQYLDICKMCGLEPELIALSSEAIAEYAHLSKATAKQAQQATALIDIDLLFTEIQIQQAGSPVFTRSLRFGLHHLEDKQQRANWVEEIRLSFTTYVREGKDAAIGRIVVTGSASQKDAVDTLLGKEFNLPVETVQPFNHVPVAPEARLKFDKTRYQVSFSSVIALTLRYHRMAINLLPLPLRMAHERRARYKKLVQSGILALCVVLLLSIFGTKKLHDKEVYREILKNKLAAIAPEANVLNKKAKLARVIKRQLDAEGSCLDVIREIYAVTPNNIYLTKFIYDESAAITLKGSSPAMSQIFKYVTTLEESVYFTNVKLRYASKRKQKESDLTDFEIYATLR